MRLSSTLSGYIGRQYAFWLASTFCALMGIALLFDVVEMMRRASGKADATMGVDATGALANATKVMAIAAERDMMIAQRAGKVNVDAAKADVDVAEERAKAFKEARLAKRSKRHEDREPRSRRLTRKPQRKTTRR